MHLLRSFKRFVQHCSTVYTCDFCRTNSMQLCRAEVATSGDFIAFLVQFVTLSGTREKRSVHACLPCFRGIFAIEIIRDNKTK